MKTSSKPLKSNSSRDAEELVKDLVSRILKVEDETESILSKYRQPVVVAEDVHRLIENILSRFHLVAREINERHEGRPTLEITDEYDVQDLLDGLLRLYFEDIRPEQWTPEYAGSSAKIDFLLKKEQIAIEVKMARKGLSKKAIGDQLIIDIAHYQKHPDCKTLYCFIYDPEEIISNPASLERDLSGKHDELITKVFVVPKRA
jgi:hypothetical protein